MATNLVRFDQLRAIAGTGVAGPGVIPATYGVNGAIGYYTSQTTPAPFSHAMRLLHFLNDTNGALAISFDGVLDNAIVLPNNFVLYDMTSNQDANESYRYQNGTQIYVRYITQPTTQSNSTNILYLTCVYGKGE